MMRYSPHLRALILFCLVALVAGVLLAPVGGALAQEATPEATVAPEGAAEEVKAEDEAEDEATSAETAEETEPEAEAPPGLTLFLLLVGVAAVAAVGFAMIGQENFRLGDEE